MADWSIKELDKWSKLIEKIARDKGLDFYDIEYEIYSHRDMLNAMSYIGIPIHYPHWSFGKAFEIQEMYYYYGLTGLPYEMVINTNPAIAYLMKDNSLLLQLLVMAHVSGHDDFFKNNVTFAHTRPELVLETFKNHAKRIRAYIDDPSIGEDKVEKILDAAHSISHNMGDYRRDRLDPEADKERLQREYFRSVDDWRIFADGKKKPEEPEYNRLPNFPEPNLLLFIRDNKHDLENWEKDILTIVDRQSRYLMPQVETKITNEGWASFWHLNIMKELENYHELPQGMYLEFLKHHNRVIAHPKGRLNPYYLGLRVFQDIEERFGRDEIFLARESMRDISFLGQYLTKELIYSMDMFSYGLQKDSSVRIEKIAEEDEWKEIKKILLQTIGRNSIPVPYIIDRNFKNNGYLLVDFKDPFKRELEPGYQLRTVAYIEKLWGKDIYWKEGNTIEHIGMEKTDSG